MPDRRHGVDEQIRQRAALVLRQARRGHGWSQLRLLREVQMVGAARGVPVPAASSLESMISRWENGYQVPDRHNRALLCVALGIAVTDLGLPDDDDV